MSTSGLTYEEMTESITGFDEIAIEKHMGIDMYTDGERKPMTLTRSLVFVHQTRQGLDALKAKEKALSMTLGEIGEYFEDDTDIDPDNPETEPGKDDSPPD